MSPDLLEAARSYVDNHGAPGGVAATPVPGLAILRELRPSSLRYEICRPLVAIVLQGTKRVAMGARAVTFGAGESLLISSEVPTASQITRASPDTPYLSLVMELDLAVIEHLVAETGTGDGAAPGPLRVDATATDVEQAALRLVRQLDRPAALAVLRDAMLRELHFWLLCGRHGEAIRALGVRDGHARRIAHAVAIIRADYARPLRTRHLAEAAGMSLSAFHAHFRALTSLTPLQFQKQLRLIQARQAMLGDGTPISTAAYAVGYESVPQFTREYRRMFGAPPGRDVRQARTRLVSVA